VAWSTRGACGGRLGRGEEQRCGLLGVLVDALDKVGSAARMLGEGLEVKVSRRKGL
jgi:hypothetical protein